VDPERVPQSRHGIEGPIDLVFIDAVGSDSLKYLQILEPALVAS